MGGGSVDLDETPSVEQEVQASDVISGRDTAVWVGGIPLDWGEDTISGIFGRFGAVAAVSLRKKSNGKCWGFILFESPVVAAQVAAYNEIREMDAVLTVKKPDHKNMSSADMRSMGHVWREMIKKTSYGKALDSLRNKIEGSSPTGPNSVLRVFKRFRELSGAKGNQISMSEFKRALEMSNVYLTTLELKKLFRDIDSNGNGSIEIDEFTQLIIGRYGDAGEHTASSYCTI